MLKLYHTIMMNYYGILSESIDEEHGGPMAKRLQAHYTDLYNRHRRKLDRMIEWKTERLQSRLTKLRVRTQ